MPMSYAAFNSKEVDLPLWKDSNQISKMVTNATITPMSSHLCNNYIMGCPPACGDNPRDLASCLSYVYVTKHGITILYHLHQCRPCPSRDSSY